MAEDQSLSSKKRDYAPIFTLILDIIILNLKFWYICIKEFVLSFVSVEKTDVRGQLVVITGTGHGIGKETALKYASLGAKVICWDINTQNNQETVKQIKDAGGEAYAYTCNVTKREEINALAAVVKKEHGFVHVLVNNAGIMPCHPLLQTTETEIRNMYEINVLAHFWTIQAFLPDMIERNEGSIVALSSCAGLFALPNLVPYCGTKFAVRGIMQSLDEELRFMNKQNKIKLTTIYPYMVDTGLCKNPRYRFSSLFKLLKPTHVAAIIVSAQRQGISDLTIPSHYMALEKVGRLFPRNAMRLVNDFLDTGVDSDLKNQ